MANITIYIFDGVSWKDSIFSFARFHAVRIFFATFVYRNQFHFVVLFDPSITRFIGRALVYGSFLCCFFLPFIRMLKARQQQSLPLR